MNCVCCGTQIPDNQGARTCSVCYGDPDHGKDGILRRMMAEDFERQALQAQEAAEAERAGKEAAGG